MEKNKIKILLIEDNPADARLVFEMLRGLINPIFKIVYANLMSEGLKILESENFDSCLLDIGLPDSRGFEGLEKITEKYPAIPVILLTGVDDEKLGIQAMQNKAADYLVKGRIDTGLLVRSIRYAVERKKMEAVLHEREQRLRLATDVAELGIFVWNIKSDRVYWENDRMYEIFGYTKGDKLLSREEFLRSTIYPEDRKEFTEKLKEGLRVGYLTNLTCRIHRKSDSAIRWLEFSGGFDVSTAPETRAICIVRDVTERKENERMLKRGYDFLEEAVKQRTSDLNKANEMLVRIFSSTHFCIVYLDKDFNFIRVNEAYAKACGHKPEFFIGKNHFDLYPHKENEAIFKKVVETGEPFSIYAKPFEFPDHPERGTTYWDWSLQPVRDEPGKIEGLIFSLVDITKRKQAEDELVKANIELDRARRLSDIGTLAATVAHELRNPLAAISMAAYNIKRKAQNPLLDQHIQNIEKKVVESDQIINNLLFYSRIRKPHLENVKIYDIIEESLDAVRNKSKKKVTVKRKLDSIKSISMQVDPLQIKEVFQNILNNSDDAVPEEGEICVEAVDDKEFIRICFKDDGPGIGQDVISKVFEPFFTTKAKGTGLGLTVCQQMVSLHGGLINIESGAGCGTIVTITLPKKAIS